MVLLINIFAALATGGAVVAGQYLGQKNKEQACKSTTQLMWSMGFISLVITAFVYACKYWILHGCSDRLRQMLCIMQMFIF